MSWDEYPCWFGRRRRWPTFFNDWYLRDIEEDMLRDFTDRIPKNAMR